KILWYSFTGLAELQLTDLRRAVREVAACSLLARHWPAKGTRQDTYLALAGGLLLGGWEQNRAERFVAALAAVTRDEEAAKRVACVAQTAGKIGGDNEITGFTRLAELLGPTGKDAARKVREWLDLLPRTAAPDTPPPWSDPEPLGEVPKVP